MREMDLQTKLTISIICCFAGGILIYLSLFDQAGSFGTVVGSFLNTLLGRAAIVFPIFLFIAGAIFLRIQRNEDWKDDLNARLIWGIIWMLMAFTGILSLFFSVTNLADAYKGGGVIGYVVYPFVLGIFGPIGGFILLLCMWIFGFFLISQLTPGAFVQTIKETTFEPKKFWNLVPDIFEPWRKPEDNDELLKNLQSKSKAEIVDNLTNRRKQVVTENPEEEEEVSNTEYDFVNKNNGFEEEFDEEEVLEEGPGNLESEELWQKLEKSGSFSQGIVDTSDFDKPVKSKGGQSLPTSDWEKKLSETEMEKKSENKPLHWVLPGFDLLIEMEERTESEINFQEKEQIIQNTLASFNIQVEMGPTVVGPTVTRYTFRPASGVKLSSINSLKTDLALSLAATSMRMELPIAGQSLVGVEIPNSKKTQVRLRNILQTDQFISFKGDLPVIIGQNVAGEDIIYPLVKMPHLLVAGATGSGKSVWINSMLICLLYRYSPADLQLILVDMKRVELKLYEKIPHLLSNVITDAQKAINALKWSVVEMDRRYKLLETYGKRNIKDYNKFASQAKIELLPYVVFVIDELGDLMMLAKNEVEPIIVRLTQMSRAVGIHLILGTQRPDVQVVTGLIKANVPSRIAFAVVSQIDSRVILDSTGAQNLLGQGDGLVRLPGLMQPVRFQGANVEESEVRNCIEFVKIQAAKNNGVTNFKPEVTEPPMDELVVPGIGKKAKRKNAKLASKPPKEYSHDSFSESEEILYQRAKKLIYQYQECSEKFISEILGTKPKITEKILLALEENGLVGPAIPGTNSRDVYSQN